MKVAEQLRFSSSSKINTQFLLTITSEQKMVTYSENTSDQSLNKPFPFRNIHNFL